MKQVFCLTILAVIVTFTYVQSAPPKFESTYETKVVLEGSKAWILCSATNDLPITYHWYNQQYGDTVTSDETSAVHISDINEGSRLIFEKVDKSHEGIYTCTAENQHGLMSKLFEIVVNPDKTDDTLVVEEVHVLNASDSSVEFLVRASASVEKYTVRYSEILDSKNNTKQFSKDEKLVLNDLVPSGLYTFQFQVVSAEGVVSEWSDPQNVTLLPYTPEVILRSLTDNALTLEWEKPWPDYQRETIDGYSLSYAPARRASRDEWEPISCFINIELPNSCGGSQYTISALTSNAYYEVRLRAHTKAGYGKPFVTKVYVKSKSCM